MTSSEKEAKDYDSLSARFIKVYNNLPLQEREQTVVVIDDEPISWKMAQREISNRTELGDRILKKLKNLDII